MKDKIKRVYIRDYRNWYSADRTNFYNFLKAPATASLLDYAKLLKSKPKKVNNDFNDEGQPCDYYSDCEEIAVYDCTNFLTEEDWFPIYEEWDVPIPEIN